MAEQCGAMCRVMGNSTGGLRASLVSTRCSPPIVFVGETGSRPAPQASECNQLLDIQCQQHISWEHWFILSMDLCRLKTPLFS